MKFYSFKTGVFSVIALIFLCAYSAQAQTKSKNAVTALTVPTKYLEADGVKYAYRRYGKKQGLPLVFLQHFTGTLDNWDPAVLDGLAEEREVIIFDNAGVAGSNGEVASTVKGIAATAEVFIKALGLKKIDLLGFSMGGFVAQQVTLDQPELINRLILVATGPRGGEGLSSFSPEVWAMLKKKYNPADELLLDTFFSPTQSSQQAGKEFLNRIRARKDRDQNINEKVIPAQLAAISDWGTPAASSYGYLQAITIPVLVVNGKEDVLFFTKNSYTLQQNLPDAQLIIYPDSNHGAFFQFHDLFVKQANLFLK